MVMGKDIPDCVGPFEDDDILGVLEGFGEVVGHEAWIGKAVKIVMDETTAAREGVGFRNGKTGASDSFFDT